MKTSVMDPDPIGSCFLGQPDPNLNPKFSRPDPVEMRRDPLSANRPCNSTLLLI